MGFIVGIIVVVVGGVVVVVRCKFSVVCCLLYVVVVVVAVYNVVGVPGQDAEREGSTHTALEPRTHYRTEQTAPIS